MSERCLDCGDIIQWWEYTGAPFHAECSSVGTLDDGRGPEEED